MGRHVKGEKPGFSYSPWFWPVICFSGLVAGVLGGTIAAVLFT